MKRRFISAFCAFAILFMGLWPTATVLAADGEEINAFTFYYDRLNDRQQYIYGLLKDYYDNLDPTPGEYKIDLSHLLPENSTEEDCAALYVDAIYADMALLADEPAYELKGRLSGGGWSSGGDRCSINIQRGQIPTEDMQNRIDARIQQLVAVAGTGDRYTQLRRLVSHMLETSFYDPYLSQINMEGTYGSELAWRGQFYDTGVMGLLLEGVAICSGFSQTFKLLCNELNIPCIIMGNASHAWNLVQMDDGQWYRVDLTTSRVGWDGEDISLDKFFKNTFLKNNTFGTYSDPYMLSLDNVALVTEFPEHANGKYRYTGATKDFSYDLPESSYTPAEPSFSYRVNPDGKSCTITNYEGEESGDLLIPETIDGYIVTGIDAYAFYYCTGFTGQLRIPDTVETIGMAAFAGCCNLTSVQLPANLHQLGNGAFIGCKGLTEIVIPDLVDTLGDYVFYDCNQLNSVTFGRHVQYIGANAFYRISGKAMLVGPAGSVVQSVAAETGLKFREEGAVCSWEDSDGQWGFLGNQHFLTCDHGGRYQYEQHAGMHCGWECPTCGAVCCITMNTFSNVNSFLEYDETNHWQECFVCHAKWDVEEHEGGTATTTELAKCNVCNAGYGELATTHTHISVEDAQWVSSAGYHSKFCECGFFLMSEEHTGGTATNTELAQCTVCGAQYGEYTEEPEPMAHSDPLQILIFVGIIAIPVLIYMLRKKK